MGVARRWIGRIGEQTPTNLIVFFAAIFLSNGVNVFTTIYARPGKPAHSLGLWCSCISSVLAAALWTAFSAKKDLIDKAALSGASDPDQRNEKRAQMWDDVWVRAMAYFVAAVSFSILAMVILVVPQ